MHATYLLEFLFGIFSTTGVVNLCGVVVCVSWLAAFSVCCCVCFFFVLDVSFIEFWWRVIHYPIPLLALLYLNALGIKPSNLCCGKSNANVNRPRIIGTFQDAPVSIFYDDEISALVAPHQHMLVGKFGCAPKMVISRDYINGHSDHQCVGWLLAQNWNMWSSLLLQIEKNMLQDSLASFNTIVTC